MTRDAPATRSDLFAFLDAHGIAHTTHEHAPVFTVEEGAEVKAALPGLHSKNLFLKSRTKKGEQGRLFLLCAEGTADVKVNALHKVLGCKRLSFGDAGLMEEVLGVTPGSVTLFALLNDTDGCVTLLLDEVMAQADTVNFHPLRNDASTAISGADAVHFAEATGHAPVVLSRAVMAGEQLGDSVNPA